MAQPIEKSPYSDANYEQLKHEPNPVITPYKHAEARELYDSEGIRIDTRYVELENGLVYPVTSSHISRFSRHTSEGTRGISHFEGVAWILRPDQQDSIYQQRLITLGRQGIEGTVVGIPQNFGTFISYDDNVNNMAGIFVNEAFEHNRDGSVAKYSGVSQAAMNGTGLVVLGEQEHGIHPIDAHLNVLCLPDGVKIKGIRDIGRVGMQLWETFRKMPYELQAVCSFANLDREGQKRLLATADLSPTALYTQPQMLRSLLSGRTGDFARRLPEDILTVAELYDNDALSRSRRWVRILGRNAGIAIQYCMDSAHVDCVSEIKQSSFTEYQTASATVLKENPQLRSSPESIGKEHRRLMNEQFPQFTTSNVPDAILRN
jgi:hypothetical protein